MNPSFGRVVSEINRELSWEMQWYIDPRQLGRYLAREIQEVSYDSIVFDNHSRNSYIFGLREGDPAEFFGAGSEH